MDDIEGKHLIGHLKLRLYLTGLLSTSVFPSFYVYNVLVGLYVLFPSPDLEVGSMVMIFTN